MSKSVVKKALKDLSAEQLLEVILELYDHRAEVKEFLDYWAEPNPQKVTEKYKLKISKIFLMGENHPRKSPDFKGLKKLLKDFELFYIGDEQLIDMHLYSMEIFFIWLRSRNKVSSQQARYVTMCKTIDEMIDSSEFENVYKLRWDRLKEEFEAVFLRGDFKDRRGWRRYFF